MAPVKLGLSHTDILFNVKMKVRVSALLEADASMIYRYIQRQIRVRIYKYICSQKLHHFQNKLGILKINITL